MAKPIKREKRQDKNKSLRPTRTVDVDEASMHIDVIDKSYQSTNKSLDKPKKKILILCEGETEESYFNIIKNEFSNKGIAFDIEIVNPEATDIENLVWEAIQIKNKNYNDYDSIWIVIDNDESNSYKLDDTTFDNLKGKIPDELFDELKSRKDYRLEAPCYEKQEEIERSLFFLSENDYAAFLMPILHKYNAISFLKTIVEKTKKHDSFDKFFSDNPNDLFYKNNIFNTLQGKREEANFDSNWKSYINLAYSCIAFEMWLLLHFEKKLRSFHNSREIYSYLKAQKHLKNYKKGYYLKAISDPIEAKMVDYADYKQLVDAIENKKPIENNLWLLGHKQSDVVKQSGKIYEVNPYSTIWLLLSQLIVENPIIVFDNQPINFNRFHNLYFSYQAGETRITIQFVYKHKSAILSKQLKSLFSIISLENGSRENLLNTDEIIIHNNDSPIIQPQFEVKMDILIDNLTSNAHFMMKLQAEDGKNGELIFFFQTTV